MKTLSGEKCETVRLDSGCFKRIQSQKYLDDCQLLVFP